MTFTSLTFVVFLSLFFAAYWLIGRRGPQNLLLLAGSLIFYSWWDVRFCGLMIGASLVDYYAALRMQATDHQATHKRWLIVSLGTNLTLLGFFKYFNFFAENLQLLANSCGAEFDSLTLDILLPVGISFYTFQTMSYSIDVYYRKLEPSRSVVEYLSFVTFFPQLVAGPIERASALLGQFQRDRRFDYHQATDGCRYILWGLVKKLIVADHLALIVEQYYSNSATTPGPLLAFATVCFAFQIYCDFSAYSDIAMGSAKLFGFNLMRNFDYPYFSESMSEFWRRWHISLSSWFRDYLYIPLGGGRASPVRRTLNTLVTFLVSGLWHGASWNFIAWGGINGATVLRSQGNKSAAKSTADVTGNSSTIPKTEPAEKFVRKAVLPRILLTFMIVCIGWVFFRAASMPQALAILGAICRDSINPEAYGQFAQAFREVREVRFAMVLLVLFVSFEWIRRQHPLPLSFPTWPRAARWSLYTSLVWLTIYLSLPVSSQFIYFQF